MESPNEMPTTADYAYDEAQNNKEKIEQLEQRVERLEEKIDDIFDILASK